MGIIILFINKKPMYKALALLAIISYVSAQSMVNYGTTVSRTVETTTTEEWNCCPGSNNHLVVTQGACSRRVRRNQAMISYPYCVTKINRRRLQSMVPQCATMGARRLNTTRRNQAMVKLCPVSGDFQCALNSVTTKKCPVVTYTTQA